MTIKKLIFNTLHIIMLLAGFTAAAQQQSPAPAPTLEQLRQSALENNKQLKISEEKVLESEALRQAALSQFFPKVSANGTYLHNSRNLQLLSDDQQQRINNMGTTLQNNLTDHLTETLSEELNFDPVFLRRIISRIGTTQAAADLNAIGQDITTALNIDLTNIYAGAVSVSQPLYMGGKLRALYSAARLSGQLAEVQHDKESDDLLLSVDEAYWRVVSLQNKQQLAQQYYNLVSKLSNDVDAMLEAEVATMAEVTQVRVKLNEAQMQLTKANLGLTLSRMVLNQICGLPLDSTYCLTEQPTTAQIQPTQLPEMEEVYSHRKELQMLELGKGIADAGVRAATSMLLPNIGLTGNYVLTNPNIYNGYQNTFAGMFTAGVVVNVPICHPDAIFAVKAAKHRRNQVQYQIEEARDKIALQVSKLHFESLMANEKLAEAQNALANAEENLQLANESFAAGLASTSDLMQAQTAWLAAKTEVADAEIELRMNRLYLQQATGESLVNEN